MKSQEAKKLLQEIVWEEGSIFPVAEGPYRYRIVVHCSSSGRQKALFANGEHTYFCYFELIGNNGRWLKSGVGIVPVLPDGRFIMVVEQRPAQSRYPNRPMVAKIAGQDVDLGRFGQHSSLEFPGGSVDSGEGLKAGFIRELQEETGIVDQTVLYFGRSHPIYQTGSDIAIQQFCGVVFLSGFYYDNYVENDGGLVVFALTRDEVQYNIWNGVIHSGQAALTQWSFYKEVERARADPDFRAMLKTVGYLTIEEVKIAKST